MSARRFTRPLLTLALLLGVLGGIRPWSAGDASAATASATYAIDWYTIDGGGASPSGGGQYALGGTIGQADAGTLTGAPYTLAGGFWAALDPRFLGNLPLVQR